jgi:hypothetical protein
MVVGRGRGEDVSYEDMARSHVKELLRSAFGWEQVQVDDDGDVPLRCGTAVAYASVVAKGRLVRVWARAAAGVPATKAVLREVNDANVATVLARVYALHEAVWIDGHLPVETLRVEDLAQLCREVCELADHLGQLLAAVHGGVVSNPEAADARTEGEP